MPDSASAMRMHMLRSEEEAARHAALRYRQKRYPPSPRRSATRYAETEGDTEDETLSQRDRSVREGCILSHMMPSFLSSDAAPHTRPVETTEEVEPLQPLPLAFMLLLHSLRLFAVVPGVIGTIVLFRHAYEEARLGRWIRTNYMADNASALEYLSSMLWSMCTAFHALSLTTMLLRRWLIYYTLLPTLIRLVTFQSISWSLVRAVLDLAGKAQPATGWIIVSTFTSLFEIGTRWITSNITDVDEAPPHDGHSDANDTWVSDYDGASQWERDDFDHLPWLWQLKRRDRYRLYREQGVRFIRVLTGAPTAVEDSESDSTSARSDASRVVPAPLADTALSPQELERWQRRIDERRQYKRQTRERRRRRKARSRMSAFFQNYRAARIHSRRVFHWDVAMWRNVMPIGVLGYVTLWTLLTEFLVTRHVQTNSSHG